MSYNNYNNLPTEENNPFASRQNDFQNPPPPTPSWLAAENVTPVNNSYNNNNSSAPPTAPQSSSSSTDAEIPRLMFYTRVINLILSVLMIVSSILSLMTTTEATTGVLACYVITLSCLLCCYETHLKQVSKQIAVNFGFLYNAKSRALFMMFVGTILFSFSLFGKIIGAAMLVNAGFNIYVVVKHPEYEEIQRRDAQSEISEFLAANPAYARSAVAFGVSAGADYAARNPDVARQGVQAWYSSQSSTSV